MVLFPYCHNMLYHSTRFQNRNVRKYCILMGFGEYSALEDSRLHYLKCLLLEYPNQKTKIGTLYLSHLGSLELLKITTYTNLARCYVATHKLYKMLKIPTDIRYEYMHIDMTNIFLHLFHLHYFR